MRVNVPPRRPISYAPGADLLAPAHRGEGRSCPGCLAHPSPLCAACGGPTAHIIPTDRHALTLCASCYGVFQTLRREGAMEHRGKSRQTRPAKESAA